MNLSLALWSFLLLGVTQSHANELAERTRGRLEDEMAINGIDPLNGRRKLTLHTDFSVFEGTWYDCLHTTLMTFNGDPADKHNVEQVGCEGGELGTVTKVGNNDQTMQFDILLLNHCFFHDLGGEGQPPCPNDYLESDLRGDGNVLVKYSFQGIGSFAHQDKIEFFSDHTYLKDENDEWVANRQRARFENKDTMICETYEDGMVCDWIINEYRTGSKIIEYGCKLNGKCRPKADEAWCDRKGGRWGGECGEVEYVRNGFVYDSFGSYYLVQNMEDCSVTCATDAPTTENHTRNPELRVPGCYFGGCCEGTNGCCDCTIDNEDDCDAADIAGFFLIDGCGPICKQGCGDRL